MILVCGTMADTMIELMCARLDDLSYEYLFFDQVHYPGSFHLSWELDTCGPRGYVTSPDRKVDVANLTGVYARYARHRGGPERPGLSKLERDLTDAEYQLSLMQLLDLLPCVVANRVKASTSNDSKIYQAFLAESFGLRTPRTLVTTDPDEVREFYEACDRRVIYKSLSSIRSIVHRLNEEDLRERLARVRHCPTQFQECIDGVDIRVHSVGDRVFATEIVSEVSDYRYAAREGAPLSLHSIDIPNDVAAACTGMTRTLGLVLSGIDLRRTPDGEYYCFEVNPSPGFLFYERSTGQPISEAVAHLLRGRASTPG